METIKLHTVTSVTSNNQSMVKLRRKQPSLIYWAVFVIPSHHEAITNQFSVPCTVLNNNNDSSLNIIYYIKREH